jgi:4-amino-4-deoxy-L-arabinose transferase-like glycosyltransferase
MSEVPQSRREIFSVATGAAVVLAVCSIVFFSGLRSIPFYEKGEPREGLVAWEIWKHGDWVLPLRSGTQIPSKPPLFHWIAALTSLSAGAFNEFTVRFPSPLLATLGVLLTYAAAVRLWGLGAGIAAAVVLATSPEWWRAATTARVDMTLTFFMLSTFLYFYFLYKSGGGLGKSLLLALFAGLATLAKGPVGAALPGIAALLFLWAKRDFAFIKRLHLPLAIPFGLVVAGSWYLLAWQQGGEKFFLRQIVHEIVGTPLGGAGHNHNPLYYVPALIAGMAPWSLFFPALAIFLFHERRRFAEKELLYPLAWFAAVFVVLSIALGKRSVYILPLYPAVALLFGAWWRELGDGGISTRWAKFAAIGAASLFAVSAALLLAHVLGWNLIETVAASLRPKEREGLALVVEAMRRHRLAILLYAGFSALAALLLIYAARKNYWRHVLAVITALMVVLFWLIQNVFHPALAAKYSFKPFMERAEQETPPSAPIVFYRGANKAAAFYARVYFPAFQQARPAKPPFFMLISEDDWTALRGEAGLTELDVSETTGWEGRQRLFLVRAGTGAEIRWPENPEPADEEAEP